MSLMIRRSFAGNSTSSENRHLRERWPRHYLFSFAFGYVAANCLMIYAISSSDLEATFLRVLVLPVGTGVLFFLASWQTHVVWNPIHRRKRETFRKRGWNWTAYRITLLVIVVLATCVLAVLGL